MILIGRASSSTAGPTGGRSQRQAPAPSGQSPAAGGMAIEPGEPGEPGGLSEPGRPGEPGGPGQLGSTQSPARPRSAGRRVAVIVDGSTESAPALRQAAAQARQRNATLHVICLVPAEADARAVTMARVRLGGLSRRACPHGVGAPVRFRVEHGDVDTVLLAIRADVELLVRGPGIVVDQAIS